MLPGAVGRYRTLRYVEQTLASVAGPSPGPDPVATRPRNVAGIDLRAEAQRVRVQQWASNSDLFEQLRADRQINTWYGGGDKLHNSFYPTPDAECYASMIGELRPNRIVEVGGGYSTLIARKAMNYFEHDCELVVVDPAPRTDVAGAADTVVRQPVERAGVEALFDERTILFAVGRDPLHYGAALWFRITTG